MKETETIKEQLGIFAGKFGPAAIVTAMVTAVNDDDTVALVFGDESTVDDARLKSIVKDGDHFVLIPKIGSIVQAGRLQNSDEYIVVAVEEITEIKTAIGTCSMKIDEDGFVFKKGTNTLWDGLKLLFEGVEQILVVQGNNPNYVKIAQGKVILKNILNGT